MRSKTCATCLELREIVANGECQRCYVFRKRNGIPRTIKNLAENLAKRAKAKGGGHPVVVPDGKVASVYLSPDDLEHCRKQPGGIAAYVRRLIAKDRGL